MLLTIAQSFLLSQYQREWGSVFYDCVSLKSITIPRSVTKVCDYAFQGCKNLQTLRYPKGLDMSMTKVPASTKVISY